MAHKVVVALLSDKQEFQLMQAAEAREAAARAGLEVDVHFADNNAVLQIHQLFKYVHAPEAERPAAIICETVTGEGLERVARNATKAGISWVLINRSVPYLDQLRAEHRDLVISNVTADQAGIGQIHARQLKALLPRGGSVLYFQGPADTSAATERLAGIQAALAGSGIELKVLNGDWTEESAGKALSTWLRLKTSEGFTASAIVGQNDSMALGARKALRLLRPEWLSLPFIGNDGLPEGGRKAVDTGELTATVITPIPAAAAVSLVARALAGERTPGELRLSARSYPPEQELAKKAALPGAGVTGQDQARRIR